MVSTEHGRERVSAVIVAAGRGTRMNMETSKQYMEIRGIPVLARTVKLFENCSAVGEVIIVVNKDDIPYCRQNIVQSYHFKKVRAIVPGGAARQESVFNGLKHLQEGCGIVLIHDGARPFADPGSITGCIDAAAEFGAACVAVRVKDTIKSADETHGVTGTLDRSKLWSVQTPQAFKYDIIMKAHQSAAEDGFAGTDDAVLAERLGYGLRIVEGSYYNIKITTQEDLVFADAIAGLKERE